jgi:hypothetical protein
VQGEKIWREELSRIVDFAVEKEATRLVSKKLDLNIDDENTYKPEFDPVDTFCPNERCIWSENKVSYYIDGDHLTHEGSAVYALAFKAQFPELFAQ